MSTAYTATVRALLGVLFLTLSAGHAEATDLRVLIQGPASDGILEFGIHDDFAGLESCGGTCFAPAFFFVEIPCVPSDTPIDVALKLAMAINNDPLAQSEGFSAVANGFSSGDGFLRVRGPRNVNYRGCVNFQPLNDQSGCCGTGSPTPGGTFTCLGTAVIPTMGEWAAVVLCALLLAAGVWRLRVTGGLRAPSVP